MCSNNIEEFEEIDDLDVFLNCAINITRTSLEMNKVDLPTNTTRN